MLGFASITEQALTAATIQTLIQLVANTNHGIDILGWGVYFDGVDVSAAPVEVVLQRQSTAGTASALTLVKINDSNGDTMDTSAQQDFTVEPTSGDVVDLAEVHPQAGYEVIYPLGQERHVGAGDRIGIRATAPAGVNVRAKIIFRE